MIPWLSAIGIVIVDVYLFRLCLYVRNEAKRARAECDETERRLTGTAPTMRAMKTRYTPRRVD